MHPLPNMLDFSDMLSVFQDSPPKGYWQIPVRPEDRKKAAVIIPFGLFEFRRCLLGFAMWAAVSNSGPDTGQPPFHMLLPG